MLPTALICFAASLRGVIAAALETLPTSDAVTAAGTPTSTVPTGEYITYSSTITVSSSAVTTLPLVSTFVDKSVTLFTTIGSTTIFSLDAEVSNVTKAAEPTETQTFLIGRPSSVLNSTTGSNSTTTSAAPSATNETPCNNYPEFCARKYNQITEVSAHNSPFIRTGNAGANQELSVALQLNDGVRLLQAQIRFVNETPHFCHTSCQVLDAGPVTSYLSEVEDWVANHPYDVVTILLGNGDYKPVTEIAPYIEKTGLVRYAYRPPKVPMAAEDWPTLSSLILSGKRVIFFMDYEANQTAVPWIIDEFSHMWETPFSPTDRSFPCTIERPPNLPPDEAARRMYITNHNLNYEISILGNSLLVPNIPLLNVTNNVTGFGSLGENAQQCNDTWHFPPRFLNVDFYNIGNGSVFQVAAKYNNVTYDQECCGKVTSASSTFHPGPWNSVLFLTAYILGTSLLLSF